MIARALVDRDVDSRYAREESAELRRAENVISQAGAVLRRSRDSILRGVATKLAPTSVRPSPYPYGAAWSSLRVTAELICNPAAHLIRAVESVLRPPVHVADHGALFQRWVGLKIVQALRVGGWRVSGDVLFALFLGGELRLQKGSTKMSLWFDPRILGDGRHPSGLRALEREAKPDIVFVTPGPCGRDAFILDPTVQVAGDHLAKKSKYLTLLEFVAPARVAGVLLRQRPLRSWAVAPTTWRQCALFDPAGMSGAIPMWPPAFDSKPLCSWLQDVEAHAFAWT